MNTLSISSSYSSAVHIAEKLLAFLFIVCIFYGDVSIGMVVPSSMLVLPGLLGVALIRRRNVLSGFSLGLFLLAGLAIMPFLQASLGAGPDRSDLGLYGPIVYAIATAYTFSLIVLDDKTLWSAMKVGGLLTAAVMVFMMTFVPPHEFIIESQNNLVVEHDYKQELLAHGNDYTSIEQHTPGFTRDMQDQAFYALKGTARNALGKSNYIAAFFVFLFSVSLFTRKKLLALAFALLTTITLSRMGMIWLGCVFLAWLIHENKASRNTAIAACLGIVAVIVYILWQSHGLQSFSTRLASWQSGFGVALDHLPIGAPRSAILEQYGYLITWNPHNSILWLVSLFGVIGLSCYAAYVYLTMSGIYTKAKESPLWTGILFGLGIMLVWSLFEIIVLTPAFEILLAVLYGLSSKKVSNAGS